MSVEIIVSLIAALGVGGILGAILNRRFEQQKQTNEHDIKIFNKSNQILTEQNLSGITGFHLLGDHSIANDDFSQLSRWCVFFGETGNQFLDKRIASENLKLLGDLNRLTDYIADNFFTIKGQNSSNKNQYLRPDWNIDRGIPSSEQRDKYNEYAKELNELTRKVMKQYSEYRLVIKRNLKI